VDVQQTYLEPSSSPRRGLCLFRSPQPEHSRRSATVTFTDAAQGRSSSASPFDSSHGSSWTVNRSAGHRSPAQAKKSTPSSSSAVRRSTPVTIQGRSWSCSVIVNENERTNVCSHEVRSPLASALARRSRPHLPCSVQLGLEAERRVAVGDQQEGVGADTVVPADHALDVVEE
jgi:hypothetical protein